MAYEFTLADIRGEIDSAVNKSENHLKEAIGDIKGDIDTLFTSVTKIKDAVNPKMEGMKKDIETVTSSFNKHTEAHEEEEEKALKYATYGINKDRANVQGKQFKWYKVLSIVLVILSIAYNRLLTKYRKLEKSRRLHDIANGHFIHVD